MSIRSEKKKTLISGNKSAAHERIRFLTLKLR